MTLAEPLRNSAKYGPLRRCSTGSQRHLNKGMAANAESMVEAQTSPRYYLGLDPLRAASAFAVLAFHVMGADGFANAPATGWASWFRAGWVGLSVFFVISGLVVGQAASNGWRGFGADFRPSFIARRLARIAPLYLFTGVVCVAFFNRGAIAGADAPWQILSHLLFVHNLWMATANSINPPSWSLGLEMQLYFVLALLAQWTSRQPALRVGVLCIGMALTYRCAVYFALNGSAPDASAPLQHLSYQLPGMIDSFGLGLALSIALANRPAFRINRCVCGALVVFGVTGLGVLGRETTTRAIDGGFWSEPLFAICARSGVALSALLVVAGCALLPFAQVSRIAPALRHAGNLSYGIYLWHFAVLSAATMLGGAHGWGMLGAVAVVTALIAEVTWRTVELPVLRWVSSK